MVLAGRWRCRWRKVEPEAGVEDVDRWMAERYDPRQFRIDVRQAPMMRAFLAQDRQAGGWLMTLLQHHLTGDHTTLEVIQARAACVSAEGRADGLAEPLPFRSLVGQARLGVSREEHETFFTKLLGDVEETLTAPFGLQSMCLGTARRDQAVADARGWRAGAANPGTGASAE